MRLMAAALMAGLFAAGGGEGAELAPGVVALGDSVFLAAADGSIGAHDAATGARRWSSSEARRPLAAQGARLLAQAPSPDGLGLALLDVASGRRVAGAVIDLPDGVSAPLDDAVDTRFLLSARQDGARVRLSWTWEYRPNRGLREEGDVDGGLRQARGGVEADLSRGRFTAVAPLSEGLVPLPGTLARDADAGAFRERPLPMGLLWVATQSTPGGLVLKRWNAIGGPLPDAMLPPAVTLQMASADGQAVLVSREVSGAPLELAHEWTVIALDTGATLATLRTSTAAAPFVTTTSRVLVVQQPWQHRTGAGWRSEPRRLEAFDRATGLAVWTQEIRDSAYRGPVAP